MGPANAPPWSSTQALTTFHERYAGESDVVFGQARLPDGRSSYEWVADRLTRAPVLDLACGDGALSEALAHRTIDVVGLDRSEFELQHARRRVPGVRFVCGEAGDLPFPEGAFAGVGCHMALMLMPEPDRVLDEVQRVLVPLGRLIVVVGRRVSCPLVEDVREALRDACRAEALTVSFPENDVTASMRRAFSSVEVVDFEASRVLEARAFPHFVRRMYYEAGLLDAWKGFEDRLFEIASCHAVRGRLHWPMGLRAFDAVRES